MQVNLVLFALYRDLTGVHELSVDVADGSSAGDVVARLRSSDARFAGLPARPVMAINREYALPEEPLRDGDELALLPPVAGG
jgi:MoaE-MoaD fusion protein